MSTTVVRDQIEATKAAVEELAAEHPEFGLVAEKLTDSLHFFDTAVARIEAAEKKE